MGAVLTWMGLRPPATQNEQPNQGEHPNVDQGAVQQPPFDEQAVHMSLVRDRHDTPKSGGIAQTFPPNPQPKQNKLPECQPFGIFQYLPENYSMPAIPVSGNADVDNIAAETVELFKSRALELRKQVDSSLREFKSSVNRSPDAALPACFESWKNLVFPWEEEFPDGGPFTVDPPPPGDDSEYTIACIFPNKHRDYLQDEVFLIGTHINDLLDASNKFLENKEDVKQQIKEKKDQLYKISIRTSTIDSIHSKLQHLIEELSKFENDISALLNDLKAAVLPLAAKRRRQTTGMQRIILQPANPSD